MKPVSVVCAVVIFLTCTCFLQSAAVPFTENEVTSRLQSEAPRDLEQKPEQKPEQEPEQEPAASEKDTGLEVLFRTKRQSHLSQCRYCCNCCKNKGCGFCCRF